MLQADRTLGDGSIFAPRDASDADLFMSVASALQTMRSTSRLDEEPTPPISKLLIHEFWARGRFYAPAITAAILRASRPYDLMPPIPGRALHAAVTASPDLSLGRWGGAFAVSAGVACTSAVLVSVADGFDRACASSRRAGERVWSA
jgi:hypothetical protein